MSPLHRLVGPIRFAIAKHRNYTATCKPIETVNARRGLETRLVGAGFDRIFLAVPPKAGTKLIPPRRENLDLLLHCGNTPGAIAGESHVRMR
jgi:hypothetical protein